MIGTPLVNRISYCTNGRSLTSIGTPLVNRISYCTNGTIGTNGHIEDHDYMAARRYEISLRVLNNIECAVTSETFDSCLLCAIYTNAPTPIRTLMCQGALIGSVLSGIKQRGKFTCGAIVSAHERKNEINSCVACLSRLMDKRTR